jgi:hypothetical protein
MPVEFCRFLDANGVEIIVNPLAVRYLVAGPPGTTRISFDNAQAVNVRGSPREVQNRLAGGSGDMEVWAPPRFAGPGSESPG